MANNAAPGNLEIVRSFVNTVEPEDEVDLLQANGKLLEWCAQTGVCPNPDDAALTKLRSFREALRAVLEAQAGKPEAAGAWRALEPYAAGSCYTLRVDGEGRLVLQPQGAGADAAVATVLGIAYNAIREGTWRRLKACRKHSCRWAFYDRSKNGSGAWCDMRVCGNRAKAQRRRAREKTR